MNNVVNIDDWRKKSPGWEKNFRRALTVDELIAALAFQDRKARVYVRCGWMAGVVAFHAYPDGVYGQPTLLLRVNNEELPGGHE
jgi:hypothetical protein